MLWFPLSIASSAPYLKGSDRALEVVQWCFCICYEFGRGVNVPMNLGQAQRWAGDSVSSTGQGDIQQLDTKDNLLCVLSIPASWHRLWDSST